MKDTVFLYIVSNSYRFFKHDCTAEQRDFFWASNELTFEENKHCIVSSDTQV